MTERNWSVFRFEGIEVREGEYSLTRAGETVTVEPTAFRVLIYLLRNAGRLVTKDEIIEAVWHGSAVSDNSLTRAVAILRRVLGDNSREPRLIATVQTIGYRVLVPVERISADTDHGSKADVTGLREEPAYKGAESLLAEPLTGRGRKAALRWIPPVGGVALLLLVLGGFYLRRSSKTQAHASPDVSFVAGRSKLVLALRGFVNDPTLSPDGRQLAFGWRSDAQPASNLYVMLIGSNEPVRLTHHTSGFVCCADFSPDGLEIAYGYCGDKGGAVFVVPALGGSERKLTDVMCTLISAGFPHWADGGRTLLLADRCTPGAPRGIVAFSLATGEKRCITSPTAGGDEWGDAGPILNPDQRTVAFVRSTTLNHGEIYAVDLTGANLRQLTHGDNTISPRIMWTPDGKYVVFESVRPGVQDTWRVALGGGPIEPAQGIPDVASFSADGRRLAYFSQGTSVLSSTWQAKLSEPGGKVVLLEQTASTSLFEDSPQLSPDEKLLVVRATKAGHRGLWTMEIDGSNPVELIDPNPGWVGSPSWSPDAKWIAMDYRKERHSQIYLVDSEGRNFHALTSGDYENEVPRWSRDGRSIYFSSNRTGTWQIWRRELATGREGQITQHGGISGIESYDGSELYYTNLQLGGLWRRPVAGGSEERVLDIPHVGYWGGFAVTEGGIYVLDADATPRPALVYYDFKTRKTNRVLLLEHRPIAAVQSVTASRDGLMLFLTQIEGQVQVLLAENAH